MTRKQALQQAKKDGFTRGIYHPYTYHARSIDSLIREAGKEESDPDYPGSAAAKTTWNYDPQGTIEADNGDWYSLFQGWGF